MEHPFFTIGHSTRSIGEFPELLTSNDIRTVVDVRTVPRSRTNPQFNRDTLPESLAQLGIGYVHIPELGGLRGRRAEIDASPNTVWQNESFRNYADYAMTEPFMAGLLKLVEIGHAARSAIMCAEAVWWRCHRRIIADYLVSRGERVMHILGRGRVDRAELSAAARLSPTGLLIYDVRPGSDLPAVRDAAIVIGLAGSLNTTREIRCSPKGTKRWRCFLLIARQSSRRRVRLLSAAWKEF